MSSSVTLNCLVLGDDPTENVFPVDVPKNANFGRLKEVISVRPRFNGVFAEKISLRRVNLPSDGLVGLGPGFGEALLSLSRVGDSFPGEPDPWCVHVLVVIPDLAELGKFPLFLYMALLLLLLICVVYLYLLFCRFVVSGHEAQGGLHAASWSLLQTHQKDRKSFVVSKARRFQRRTTFGRSADS